MHGARRSPVVRRRRLLQGSGSEASFGFAQDGLFTTVLDVKGWPALKITASGKRLLGVEKGTDLFSPFSSNWPKTGWHGRLLKDLAAFFEGKDVDWSYVRLNEDGLTMFTREVIREMQRIARSKVKTYGELAKCLNSRGVRAAPQAVGQACGRNPWPLVVPCHRVVAAGGIGGFGWGVKWKRRLLALEGVEM